MRVRFLLVLSLLACILTGCIPVPHDHGFGHPKDAHLYRYAGNIWTSMGYRFSLPNEASNNSDVKKQIRWYMSNRVYLRHIATASKPYIFYVYQQVRARNLPAEFALLPFLESNYDPFAYSKVGAAGLWQMMPGTATGFGLKIDWWYDGRRDVAASTQAALDYLKYLGEFFHHDWLLALAAYNVGEGAVQKAVRYNQRHHQPTDFWHLPLPQQTRAYVPKLLALATIIKHPKTYSVEWTPILNAPYLAQVKTGSQIEMIRAAKLAGISLKTLSKLNPGFQRWATDPEGPHSLLVPVKNSDALKEGLKNLKSSERVTWNRYVVKKGDSLITIAKKNKTTTALLKQANHLKSTLIHPKTVLLIPSSHSQLTHMVLQSEQHYFSKLRQKFPEVNINKYQVKKGDTINGIAKKFHVKCRELMFWNGLKCVRDLSVGKDLVIIPPRKHRFATTFQHKIRVGESLNTIAKLYHVSVKDLKRQNHLKTNTVRAGKVLNIPVVHYQTKKQHAKMISQIKRARSAKSNHAVLTYHVKSGDSLWTIAKTFGVSTKDLKRWNPSKNPDRLKLGQPITIYK